MRPAGRRTGGEAQTGLPGRAVGCRVRKGGLASGSAGGGLPAAAPSVGKVQGMESVSPLWLWVSLEVSSVYMLGRVTCMTYKDIAVSWKQDSASLSCLLGYRGSFSVGPGAHHQGFPQFCVCSMGSGAGTPRPTPVPPPVPPCLQRVHRQLGGGSRPVPAPLRVGRARGDV